MYICAFFRIKGYRFYGILKGIMLKSVRTCVIKLVQAKFVSLEKLIYFLIAVNKNLLHTTFIFYFLFLVTRKLRVQLNAYS